MRKVEDRRNFAMKMLAVSLCAASVAGILASFVLTYLNDSGLVSSGLPFLPFASAVVGFMIATRQPRNLVGWIFLFGAFFATVRAVSGEYAIYGLLIAPGEVPFAELSAWLAVVFRMPGPMLSFVALPLFFPNGKVPSPRWRILVWGVVLTTIPVMALDAFAPGVAVYDTSIQNPFGVESLSFYSRMFYDGGTIIFWFIALIFLSAASIVFRYRASGTVERQQIKWLTFAIVFIPIWFSVNEPINRAFPLFFIVADSLIIAGIPVAAGLAILRYRLYDIDVIINKTIVYASLTVSLVAVYFGLVVGSEYVLRGLLGADSQIAIVASTLAIAALFTPMRRRIQNFIDRRFYRRRYNARETLEAFSARLRDGADLDDLTRDLASVARKTMQPAHVSLWMRPPKSESPEKISTEISADPLS